MKGSKREEQIRNADAMKLAQRLILYGPMMTPDLMDGNTKRVAHAIIEAAAAARAKALEEAAQMVIEWHDRGNIAHDIRALAKKPA